MAATQNIVQLTPRKTTRKPAKATRRQPISARMARRLKLQHGTALLLGAIAAAMTTVSLAHIAGGVESITHGAIPHWQAVGVAIGLDVNYVAMEMAGVVAAMQHVRDRLHRLTRIGVPTVMAFSMALNALEFAAGHQHLRAGHRHRDGRHPAGLGVLDVPGCRGARRRVASADRLSS